VDDCGNRLPGAVKDDRQTIRGLYDARNIIFNKHKAITRGRALTVRNHVYFIAMLLVHQHMTFEAEGEEGISHACLSGRGRRLCDKSVKET
jgi:hypothetical protein